MLSWYKKIQQQKGLPYLFTKIVLFVVLLIAADQLTGRTLRYFFSRQKSGWERETTFALNEAHADIVILGSSRAQHSYNTEIIARAFNMSCYNAGRDGQSILYHYPVFKAMLDRYTPKMVILDCESDMFSINSYSYERISCLLPYYHTHPNISSYIALRSPYEKYKLLSATYPYNSMILKIAAGNIKNPNPETDGINGYLPLPNSLHEPIRTVDYTSKEYPLDTVKLNLYKQLIADCKSRNIQLYVCTSPYFSHFIGEESSVKGCRETAQSRQIPYFDFSFDTSFLNHSDYFDDTAHVNHQAATLFTNLLCEKIQQAQTGTRSNGNK